MVEQTLIELGLTSNETKTYLTLLDIGCSTVTSISEKTKLHRTNVYDAIKKLTDKGLVSYMKQDNITFYEASTPRTLMALLKEKEQKLNNILPQLLLNKKLSENTSDFLIIKGTNPFIETLHELLEKKHEIKALNIPEKAIKIIGARIFPFHKERTEKKITLKQIYHEEQRKNIKETNDELTKTKFYKKKSNVSNIMCKDETLITDWTKEIITIRIKNEAITKHYEEQFEIVWYNIKS